jgi:hypothetical protein
MVGERHGGPKQKGYMLAMSTRDIALESLLNRRRSWTRDSSRDLMSKVTSAASARLIDGGEVMISLFSVTSVV